MVASSSKLEELRAKIAQATTTLEAELESVEPQIVVGVLRNVTKTTMGNQPTRLRIGLAPWRTQEGVPVQTDLKLTCKLESDLGRRIEKCVVRGRAASFLVRCKAAGNGWHGIVEQFLGETSDPHLVVTKAESVTDDVLGHVDPIPGASSYRAEVEWQGKPLSVLLEVDSSGDLDRSVSVARDVIAIMGAWDAQARARVEGLRKLYNEVWRPSSEAELDSDAFHKRVAVESIVVSGTGDVQMFMSDGGLFGGHRILVQGRTAESLGAAELA